MQANGGMKGILGMNVLQQCWEELLSESHKPHLKKSLGQHRTPSGSGHYTLWDRLWSLVLIMEKSVNHTLEDNPLFCRHITESLP